MCRCVPGCGMRCGPLCLSKESAVHSSLPTYGVENLAHDVVTSYELVNSGKKKSCMYSSWLKW